MASIRVLHVDDEPDIRTVVEMSLGLDSAFAVRSCASGEDAITAAADWPPDLILLDVMMPDMDGPTTLTRMRAWPQTARVPVVFLTVRAQASEQAHFLSLGVAGVIAKPFNPMTLGALLRRYAPAAEAHIALQRNRFLVLARADAAMLTEMRLTLDGTSPAMLRRIKTIAHDVAEAAGVYGLQSLSVDAGALEDAVVMIDSAAGAAEIERRIHDLLVHINNESVRAAVQACRETAARFGHSPSARERHATRVSVQYQTF
jgi:two-component system OmpR family response regulator